MSRKDLSEKLGITPYGFDRMIRDETMKISTFEKLYKLFEVPISYWFEEEKENISMLNEAESNYVLPKKSEMKQLEKDLEYFRERVIKLEKENDLLKENLNPNSKAQGE